MNKNGTEICPLEQLFLHEPINLIFLINYLLIWTYTDSLNESTGADNNSTITQMRSLETE